SSADGTAPEGVWESRTPPNIEQQRAGPRTFWCGALPRSAPGCWLLVCDRATATGARTGDPTGPGRVGPGRVMARRNHPTPTPPGPPAEQGRIRAGTHTHAHAEAGASAGSRPVRAPHEQTTATWSR